MSASTPNSPDGEPKNLKRLGLVSRLVALALLSVNVVYLWFRSLVPSLLLPTVKKLEETAAAVAAPTLTKCGDYYSFLLRWADDEADFLLSLFGSKVSDVKSTAKAGTDSVTDVAQPYLRALSKLTHRIHTASGIEAAQHRLHDVISKADPDAAVQVASDAWARFAAFPPVALGLRIASPFINFGLWAFQVFHDRLVSTYLYKVAVDTAAGTLTYASTTTPYKLGAQYLYPVVQPVAEPAIEIIDKVNSSNTIRKTVEFWKPVVV